MSQWLGRAGRGGAEWAGAAGWPPAGRWPALPLAARPTRRPGPRAAATRRGGLQYGWEKTPDAKKAWISAAAAGGAMLLSIVAGIPFIRSRVARDMEALERWAGGWVGPRVPGPLPLGPGGL